VPGDRPIVDALAGEFGHAPMIPQNWSDVKPLDIWPSPHGRTIPVGGYDLAARQKTGGEAG
jgi:hypothetical protein